MLVNHHDLSKQIFPKEKKTTICSVGVLHEGRLMVRLKITFLECVGVTNLNRIINTKNNKSFISLCLKNVVDTEAASA